MNRVLPLLRRAARSPGGLPKPFPACVTKASGLGGVVVGGAGVRPFSGECRNGFCLYSCLHLSLAARCAGFVCLLGAAAPGRRGIWGCAAASSDACFD